MSDPQLGMVKFSEEKMRLNKLVDYANTSNGDLVIICGDLVHHASDSTFSQFKSIIEKLNVPCYLLPGNHDMGKVFDKKSIKRYKEYFGNHYYKFNYPSKIPLDFCNYN
jgi:serine/threonine-protein phosphatase CPPED1